MSDTGDALVEIMEEGGEGALGLIGTLMEHNARSNSWMMERLLEEEIAAHNETKERLRGANRHIRLISRRIEWMLGGEVEWER
jgi:hypothetical protein